MFLKSWQLPDVVDSEFTDFCIKYNRLPSGSSNFKNFRVQSASSTLSKSNTSSLTCKSLLSISVINTKLSTIAIGSKHRSGNGYGVLYSLRYMFSCLAIFICMFSLPYIIVLVVAIMVAVMVDTCTYLCNYCIICQALAIGTKKDKNIKFRIPFRATMLDGTAADSKTRTATPEWWCKHFFKRVYFQVLQFLLECEITPTDILVRIATMITQAKKSLKTILCHHSSIAVLNSCRFVRAISLSYPKE